MLRAAHDGGPTTAPVPTSVLLGLPAVLSAPLGACKGGGPDLRDGKSPCGSSGLPFRKGAASRGLELSKAEGEPAALV